MFSKETHFKYKDTWKLKVNAWGKINHVNTSQKRARTAILISHRADFRARKVPRNKERHHIIIKSWTPQENNTVFNMSAPNSRVSKYMRQKLIELQGEIID